MVSLRLSPGHMPINPSSHLDLNISALLLPFSLHLFPHEFPLLLLLLQVLTFWSRRNKKRRTRTIFNTLPIRIYLTTSKLRQHPKPLSARLERENDNSPFDNHPLPNLEVQWLPTVIAWIKLAPIACQGAAIMYWDGVTDFGPAGAVVRKGIFRDDFRSKGGRGKEGQEGWDCKFKMHCECALGFSGSERRKERDDDEARLSSLIKPGQSTDITDNCTCMKVKLVTCVPTAPTRKR